MKPNQAPFLEDFTFIPFNRIKKLNPKAHPTFSPTNKFLVGEKVDYGCTTVRPTMTISERKLVRNFHTSCQKFYIVYYVTCVDTTVACILYKDTSKILKRSFRKYTLAHIKIVWLALFCVSSPIFHHLSLSHFFNFRNPYFS